MQTYIGLGGNLGAVATAFRQALDHLNTRPDTTVARVSSFVRTPPMGEAAGEPYLNAAAKLETNLSPLELLDALQAVEHQHGRTRAARWGPRTLDLDLLLYDGQVLNHPRLMVPHPGCWYRRFVLDPLSEIAPAVLHPVKKATIEELRTCLLESPLPVGICGGNETQRQEILQDISNRFANVQARAWMPRDRDPLALLLWLEVPTDQDLRFEDLPVLPRLDLTTFSEDPATAVRHVLTAAVG